MGTLISTTPAVWKAPLHYRALQRSLIISLNGGRSKSKSVRISHPGVVRELNWWASGGLRANRTSPWCPPKPTLQIWTDASMSGGGSKTESGLCFQCTWSEQEARKKHQLAGTKSSSIPIIRVSKPWRRGSASRLLPS